MEGYLAEIRFFAGNFAPRGWAFCQGQFISLAQNTALFSLLGTTYGGNGQTNFALPNFKDRIGVGAGQGPGLSPYSPGQTGGAVNFTITTSEMPAHSHQFLPQITMPANSSPGNADSPVNAVPATFGTTQMYGTTATAGAQTGNLLTSVTTSPIGAAAPVQNLHPVLGFNFIICIEGNFPSRN